MNQPSRPLMARRPLVLPVASATAQAITSTTAVRMAVPRFESMPAMPSFARMEVRAAKKVESRA